MEMPSVCVCGELFDFNDGNPCKICNGIFCEECVPEPWEVCPGCKTEEQEDTE